MPFSYPERDPNAQLIKFIHRTDSTRWPAADSSKLFILGAVTAVGATLHGDEWTGLELTAVRWPESPKNALARSRRPVPQSISNNRLPVRRMTNEDLKAEDEAAEARQVRWEENGRAVVRLKRAVDWLAQRCRDGELTTYWRLRSGGSLLPMRASEWNVEDPLSTFVSLGGNKRWCNEFKPIQQCEVFVFFLKTELAELLQREPKATLMTSEADLSRLSPYLRLAVHIALTRGYFEGADCDTQDSREAEVRAAWPNFIADIEPVKSTVQQIAKLMAFPDRKAIELGQRGAQSRKTG